MPEIIVKYAGQVIERIVTEKDHISIGRTSENDIVLDNRGVSRRHARIELSNSTSELIDLDSLNGTFLNQIKVSRQELRDDDSITIGKFELVFYRDSQAANKRVDASRLTADATDPVTKKSDSKIHNPLEGLMETRPIPVSPHGEARIERKEHR